MAMDMCGRIYREKPVENILPDRDSILFLFLFLGLNAWTKAAGKGNLILTQGSKYCHGRGLSGAGA